jgi:hypothetical protein
MCWKASSATRKSAIFQEIFFGNLQLGIDVRIIFCYNSYTVRHPSVYVADVKAR